MALSSDSQVIVFAYGSNMCTARIRQRVSGAEPLGTGFVAGRKLTFHKRGLDGSGKADAWRTGRAADRVWGVLYELPADQKTVLDGYESLGIGYGESTVRVETTAGVTPAQLYEALEPMIDPSLRPFSWYRDYVIDGAVQHGLPEDYIEAIRRFESLTDSDKARRMRNRAHRSVP